MDDVAANAIIESLETVMSSHDFLLDEQHRQALNEILTLPTVSRDDKVKMLFRLFSDERDLHRVVAKMLWKEVWTVCSEEVKRLKEIKLDRPLHDEEADYLLGVLLPLHCEAVNMAVMAGVNVDELI